MILKNIHLQEHADGFCPQDPVDECISAFASHRSAMVRFFTLATGEGEERQHRPTRHSERSASGAKNLYCCKLID